MNDILTNFLLLVILLIMVDKLVYPLKAVIAMLMGWDVMVQQVEDDMRGDPSDVVAVLTVRFTDGDEVVWEGAMTMLPDPKSSIRLNNVEYAIGPPVYDMDQNLVCVPMKVKSDVTE